MRIAVTYENGQVFQHFGHTETFKIYDVEDGRVVSSELAGSNGTGHGALAGLLASHLVDVLICGGIGGGAQAALAEQGIELCAGAEGSADAAVEAYLRGELVNTGANCDHHGEGHSCGHHGDGEEGHCGHHGDGEEGHCGHHGHSEEAGDAPEESGCGEDGEGAGCGGCGEDGEGAGCSGCGDDSEGGCGGCGGGCHGRPIITGVNVGKKVRVHYRGTFDDGTQFDSSYDRGEPLEFVCGAGMMILGFDAAVADMKVGEIVNVHLMPEEAYGRRDPRAILTTEIARMPGAEALTVGQKVYLRNMQGQPIPVTVTAKDDTMITFDANHEMAGKELNFTIELVEIL